MKDLQKPSKRAVSKSTFKARALQYLKEVETSGEMLVITDRGRPVVKIVPFGQNSQKILEGLRGVVRRYSDPMEPVASEDWEALR